MESNSDHDFKKLASTVRVKHWFIIIKFCNIDCMRIILFFTAIWWSDANSFWNGSSWSSQHFFQHNVTCNYINHKCEFVLPTSRCVWSIFIKDTSVAHKDVEGIRFIKLCHHLICEPSNLNNIRQISLEGDYFKVSCISFSTFFNRFLCLFNLFSISTVDSNHSFLGCISDWWSFFCKLVAAFETKSISCSSDEKGSITICSGSFHVTRYLV